MQAPECTPRKSPRTRKPVSAPREDPDVIQAQIHAEFAASLRSSQQRRRARSGENSMADTGCRLNRTASFALDPHVTRLAADIKKTLNRAETWPDYLTISGEIHHALAVARFNLEVRQGIAVVDRRGNLEDFSNLVSDDSDSALDRLESEGIDDEDADSPVDTDTGSEFAPGVQSDVDPQSDHDERDLPIYPTSDEEQEPETLNTS